MVLRTHDGGLQAWRQERDAQSSHLEPQWERRKEQGRKDSGVLNSASVPSDVLLGRLHPLNLPTQCHQLGTSVPMPEAAGDIFHSDHCMEALGKGIIIDRASPRNRC